MHEEQVKNNQGGSIMSLTIYANMANYIENGTMFTQKEDNGNRKAFFAGNTNLANDPIAQKRKEAQQKAMKVVSDAWDTDKSINKSVEDRKSHYDKMLVRKEEAQAELKRIAEEKAVLKESYGIEDDSKEQKDIEFIQKAEDYLDGDFHNGVTQEDIGDYIELRKQPLTEYQKRVLELHEMEKQFKAEIQDADDRMKDDISDIKAIALERLKSNPMVDAQKTAEAIKAAANDEIIGMAMKQAKEHIDEKLEEAQEKAEKKAEEEEIEEERLEEIQEKRALQEALIAGTKEAIEEAQARQQENEVPDMPLDELIDLTKTNTETQKAQKVLQEIKFSMNLLEADLKGIEIDEEA